MSVETRFGANTTGFTRGVDSMQSKVKGLGGQLQSSIGGGMKGLFAGLAAGFSVGAIKGIFEEYDRIAKLAGQLSTTGESVQRLAHATDLSGGSVEMLAKQFVTATQKVREFRAGLKLVGDEGQTGNKLGRAMSQLGIQSKDFVSADLEKQVLMIARGMEKMEDPTLANAAAMDLLGTRAKDLLPLLQSGEAGIKEMMDSAKILSEDDLRRIQEFNDQMTTLGQNLKALGAQVGLKAMGLGQMFAGAGLAIGGTLGKIGGLVSDDLDQAAERWLSAAGRLQGEMDKNLFGKENSPKVFSTEEEDKRKEEDAARIETETKILQLRTASEEKVAGMRAKSEIDALSNEHKIARLKRDAARALEENDFAAYEKASADLIKAEKDAEKETQKAIDEKRAAVESIAQMEKDLARERLSVEEQIAELRKEAIEQAEAGNFKAAAEAGKELTNLIGQQIDERRKNQESLQGNSGVIADSLRKSGLGGVAVSASINKSILQVNKDQVQELRQIKQAIASQDSTPRFK